MKRFSILLLVLTLSFTSCKSQSDVQSQNQNLKVMTYNIRLNVASDGENAWPNRKDFLSSQVLFYSPDIMGVQEALPNQMTDLKNALKGYNAIGLGRDGGNEGEHSAIFYNTKKVKVENETTFWLSNTPNEVSKGWDAALPRVCTYGLFTILGSNQKVWVFNTHLDHIGEQARLESMKLIVKKIKEVNTSNLPAIVMGDFNLEPDSEAVTMLKKYMNDSRELAKIKFGSTGTFNAFKFHEPVNQRIDYIMVSKSDKIEVEKYGVLSSNIDLKYPSDHFPVLVEFKIK